MALATSRDLSAAMAEALVAVRQTARTAGAATLRHEFASISSLAAEAGMPLAGVPREIGMSQIDRDRASRVGQAYAQAWLASALGRLNDPDKAAGAFGGAARDQRFRIEMVAATETSQAFNAERDEAATDYVQRQDGNIAPLLLKTWDATLDRATCSTCKGLDGTIRPWGFDFPGFAVPGDVHPRCRCIEGFFFVPIPLEQAA